MSENLEKYFKVDEAAFYINNKGERKFWGVNGYYNDTTRNDKAIEQSKLKPVEISKVIYYANKFLNMVRKENKFHEKMIRCESLKLDGKNHIIIDNGIIVTGCDWEEPVWCNKERKYLNDDIKYKRIKERFGLERAQNIVWLKFTKDGYLGVVARSFDINFDIKTSSGILVKQVEKQWDDSFVIIFPLTFEILKKYKKWWNWIRYWAIFNIKRSTHYRFLLSQQLKTSLILKK